MLTGELKPDDFDEDEGEGVGAIDGLDLGALLNPLDLLLVDLLPELKPDEWLELDECPEECPVECDAAGTLARHNVKAAI